MIAVIQCLKGWLSCVWWHFFGSSILPHKKNNQAAFQTWCQFMLPWKQSGTLWLVDYGCFSSSWIICLLNMILWSSSERATDRAESGVKEVLLSVIRWRYGDRCQLTHQMSWETAGWLCWDEVAVELFISPVYLISSLAFVQLRPCWSSVHRDVKGQFVLLI